MEELREINFQALIEGQDYEKALHKIVSTLCTLIRIRMRVILDYKTIRTRTQTERFLKYIISTLGILFIPLHAPRGSSRHRTVPKASGQGIHSS